MATYTVTKDDTVLGRGLSVAEAAREILTDDGREWSIRPEAGGGFTLWSRQQVAGIRWARTVLFSAADTVEEAEAEIFARVLTARWKRHPEAMSDEEFDKISG